MKTINIKQCLLALAIMCLSPWAGAVTYVYDDLNRLVSATYPSIGTITYNYDAAGNLLSLAQTPVAIAPTATTTAASSISAAGATLNGNINANGASTAVTFDYGPTIGYGTNTAATPATVAAFAGSTVALPVSGLNCNAIYHFRVKGVNSAGTTNGSDLSFTTSACPVTLPGTPTLNTVAFGRGSASVSFTPAISGGIATTYTASCTAPGHAARTGSGASSPVTVSGLTGGVVYSCSVVASNSAGSSTPSAAMLVTPLKGSDITPILMLLLD